MSDFTPPRRRRPRAGVTIQDVAAAAGVSIGTVSRVMNDRNWVSPVTRERVLEAVRATGFVANARARSLVTQRSNSVALVLGAPATRLFEDPNYAVIIQEASAALAESDYALVLLTAASEAERARVAAFIRAKHVDGVIFVSPAEEHRDALIQLFESHVVPVIVAGNPLPETSALPRVFGDERVGARALGTHFRERGYRRTAAIAAYAHLAGPTERVDAFRSGLQRELVQVESASDYSWQSGYDAAVSLLASTTRPDSIFATSDLLAAGAVDAIQRAGLRVPDDIAVAGFDDSAIATRVSPALTTVRLSVADGARTLVRSILGAIETGDEPEPNVMPSELIVRESA